MLATELLGQSDYQRTLERIAGFEDGDTRFCAATLQLDREINLGHSSSTDPFRKHVELVLILQVRPVQDAHMNTDEPLQFVVEGIE
jgi:hypothetical protein